MATTFPTKREVNKALNVYAKRIYEIRYAGNANPCPKWTVAEVGTMVSLCADQDVPVRLADEMKKFFEETFREIIERDPHMGHPGPNCVNGNTVMTWSRA